MEDLYRVFENVALTPYQEVVPVTRGDTTKEIAITTVGSDVSATSHKAEEMLMKVMLEFQVESPRKER